MIILNDIQTKHRAILLHIEDKMCFLLSYVKEEELFEDFQ